MSLIDVEKILAEISPDDPAGPNLDEQQMFMDMDSAAEGTPERGGQPPKPPDWKDLKTKALEILEKSKDLRAAVHLARALLNTHGFAGFSEGLNLIADLLEKYWDTLNPVLDAEEDFDPEFRLNILSALTTDAEELGFAGVEPPIATLRAIRFTPLVTHPQAGSYCLRDIEIASGKTSLPSGWKGDPPDTAVIEAVFMEVDLEQLQATATAIVDNISQVEAIDAALAAHLDPSKMMNLSSLTKLLQQCLGAVAEPLARRGAPVEGADIVAPSDQGAGGGGAVNSREDVVVALDRICDFYSRTEPSSPVPILLQRARRLVSMDFMEIVRDLVPSGVTELEKIRGKEK